MAEEINIFDRGVLRTRRDRAAGRFDQYDFLIQRISEDLADRLDDVKRTFPLALDLGCRNGVLAKCLNGRGSIDTLIQSDLSWSFVIRAGGIGAVADEEMLPFADGTFDLILSAFTLHWVNDLPGTLVQIRRALKPDGLFLGVMLGGETLKELRQVMAAAEIATEGGLSPRVSPFADVRDAGALMQRAGFALPVVDSESYTIMYRDPLRLLEDLRGMGETNVVAERRKAFTRRETMFSALTQYRESFADPDGRVPATFQAIFFTGWSPHDSQPQPLRRGTATVGLADALDETRR